MMVAQVATELIKRAKANGKKVTKESLYEELLAMNGDNAFKLDTTVGPVTYSKTDHEGVDNLQLYSVQKGVFKSVGEPFSPKFAK